MKLLCIRECVGKVPPQMKQWMVVKGKEYESVGSELNEDGLFFYLAGMPDFCAYTSEFFTILPEQSADQMSEESKEAIANLEHKTV